MNFSALVRWRWLLLVIAGLSLFLGGWLAGQNAGLKLWLLSSAPRNDGLRVDPAAVRAADDDIWLNGQADLVLAGDSIIAGGRWDEMLPGMVAHNRGIGGDTVSGLYRRTEALLAKSPRQLVVMIGVNDIMAGSAIADIVRQYDALLQRLVPGRHVIILSVLPCARPRCDDDDNDRIAALNSALAKVTQERRAQFLDLTPHFANRGHLARQYSYDGVHLNGEGYRLLRDLLLPHLCRAGPCPPIHTG